MNRASVEELIEFYDYRASCATQDADDTNQPHIRKIRIEDARKFRDTANILSEILEKADENQNR